MSRSPSPDYVSDVRATLAMNLRSRMDAFYPGMSETRQAEQLGKDAGIGKNTVLRMIDLDYDGSPKLDALAKVASQLGCEIADLLRDHGKKNKKNTKVQSVVRTTAEPLKGALQRRTGS
jgi:DNA-binding phage protein